MAALTPASWRAGDSETRGCESSISLEYLTNLHRAYEDFVREISKIIPVIKVNYEKFKSVDEMASAITAEYQKLSCIRFISFDAPSSTAPPPPATRPTRPVSRSIAASAASASTTSFAPSTAPATPTAPTARPA